MINYSDVLIIGSGVSGLSFALKVAHFSKVTLITKKRKADSATNLAQGGVAAAVGRDDTAELHEADTLRVGRGLCRLAAVELLTEEASRHLRRLRELGVDFDSHGTDLELALEAGHSRRRIAHAGGGGTGQAADPQPECSSPSGARP